MIYLVSSIQSWGYRHWTLHFEEKDSIPKILKSSLLKKKETSIALLSSLYILSEICKYVRENGTICQWKAYKLQPA